MSDPVAPDGDEPAPDDFLMQSALRTKKKTHRGRRGRGFGAKPPVADAERSVIDQGNAHDVAKEHAASAASAATPEASRMHLFNALSALKKAK